METVSFEDFIPTYPEDSDPDIQELITLKNEFLEVSGKVSEPIPKPGQYYRHQKALFRYMLYHDRMLNIQETGTGKTCSLVAIAEYYKKYKEEKNIKHVYVLEKGGPTVEEFKRQIACNCTPENNEYITEKVTDITIRESSRKSNLTRSLHRWYTVKSYGVFASEISKKNLTDQQLEDEYSGCIFFVDEAHNLSEDKSTGRKKEESEDVSEDIKQEVEKSSQYDVLWRLFHVVKRCKIILGTATPMINEVNEIAPIMNLILPIDQQMPTEKWNYEKVTLEQLEPFFRGRVSYVRGLDTGAQIVYQGEKMNKTYEIEVPKENQTVEFLSMQRDIKGRILSIPKQPKLETETKVYQSQSIVEKVLMSPFQQEGYAKAAGEDRKEEGKKEEQAFYLFQRHAASFVFPDKSYSGDFTRNMTSRAGKFIKPEFDKEGKRKPGSFILDQEFKERVNNIQNLKEMSAKYAFIVENELKPENFGNAFCFTDLVTGSGAILFGKILEGYGFERFKELNRVFQTTETKKVSICAGDSKTKTIKSTFPKKLRYGLLSSDMSDTQRNALLELFNSYENRNGEYCKILIGIPSFRDGINVFNVRRGYLLSPTWHPSGMHQALSRFIRSTSHQMLIDDEKERLRKEGKDPSMASVLVKIYKMASVRSFADTNSADLLLYQIIERKDIHIRRMMRFLKQCAFDCPIHYERNIRPGDVNGTAICDYTTCKYTCARSEMTNKVKASDIDFSTYDILYSDEVIESCKLRILQMMKERTSVAMGCLYSILGEDYKRRFINAAVESIVRDRLSITDRFGYPCYLNTNGVLLYTQGDLPSSSQSLDLSDLSYYKDMLFGKIPSKFDDLIKLSTKSEEQEIIDKIIALKEPNGEDYEKFDEYIEALTETTKVELLERYLEKSIIENYVNPLSSAFEIKFRNYIINTFEPLEDIEAVKQKLEEDKFKPGREREETNKPKVDIPFKGAPPGDRVYADGSSPKRVVIHTYTGTGAGKTTYNEFANFRKSNQNIRIYISGETWRDVKNYEWPVYNHLVKQHTDSILKQFEGFDEFGLYLSNERFAIVNTKKLFSETEDTRSKERGMECKSFQKLPLIEILLKYNYKDPDIERIPIPKELSTRDSMLNYLLSKKIVKKGEDLTRLENYSKENLYFIYRYDLQMNKESICEIISILFAERNLMLVL